MGTGPWDGLPDDLASLHPFCRECGWRKGGVDSWDGVSCKCGEYMPSYFDLRQYAFIAKDAIAKAAKPEKS